MADIRLKKITVEAGQSPLIIQNGNVNITNTTDSESIIVGSFVTNGGISIGTSKDCISSTSGGALTVGGGVAIMKNLYVGKNLVLDSTNNIFKINGLNTNRLFLDTISNKNFYISPDGINKRFDLTDVSLQINITTSSTNSSSGALTVNGGISIDSTVNLSNGSNGGALTVAGGVAIAKNMHVVGSIFSSNGLILDKCIDNSNQLTLNNSLNISCATINVTDNNLLITNSQDTSINSSNIYLNQNTIISQNDITFKNHVSILDTTVSTSSSGCLLLHGGQNISNTVDAISVSNGGSFTTLGGVAIAKRTYIGDSLALNTDNSRKNKLVLDGDLDQTDLFTGLGNSQGSMLYQISNTTSNHLFYSAESSNSSKQIFKISGNGDIAFSGKSQEYSIKGGGKVDSDLSFQSNDPIANSSVNFFTSDNINKNNDICIFGLGLPNETIDSEHLRIGWNSNLDHYSISTQYSGSGSGKNLVLGDSQIILQSSGNIMLGTDETVPTTTIVKNLLNINSTDDNAVTINGGATIEKKLLLGNTLVLGNGTEYAMKLDTTLNNSSFSTLLLSGSTNKYPSIHVVGDSTVSSAEYPFDFSLYSLGDSGSLNNESLQFKTIINGYNIKTTRSGVGFARFIDLHTLENDYQLMLQTSGNVGIGNENPNSKLDINGTLNCNDIVTFTSSVDSINSSTAGLIINGGISIMTSTNADSIENGGAITIAGGASIAKNLLVGGRTEFLDTTPSTSYLDASVVINGGLSIQSGEEAINVGNGGGLSVAGGASVGGDLYVGGSINGSGSSSSTYAYMTLTATDESINLSSGSLVTYGGITIQTDINAVNVSNGGSFLTPGGMSIGKDLYLGGNIEMYGVTNYHNTTDDFINLYDNFNIRRFSINKSTVSQNFSLSRYNSLGNYVERIFDISNANGNVIFNNTTPSTLTNDASIVFLGGISISNTNNSVSLENGGSFTLAGGISIAKNMKIGGDVYIYSTTGSSNVSTGAVLISGGVGISGDVNVLGNTQIIGNLTVNGQTTSINAVNTVIKDNLIVLNSGPTGSKDSGFIIQRYQQDNDTGLGDVVADINPTTISLPNQSGMNATQIKLSSLDSALDDYYTGWWLKINSGYSTNQVRKITSYNGTTKIATISSNWTTQNPSGGDNIYLYNKPFVGFIYNEINDRFEFGSTIQDPGQSSVTFSDHLPMYFSSATCISTQVSTNSSTGALCIAGGISISNTTDSSSITRGGTFTTLGGASIGKTLHVGDNLYVNNTKMTPNPSDIFSSVTFNVQNNQSSFSNIVGLYFDNTVWGFDIYLCAKISASANLYTNFHIRGINKNGSWEIIKTYVGDDTGIQFSISDYGQLQYTTPNYSEFTLGQFRYRALVN